MLYGFLHLGNDIKENISEISGKKNCKGKKCKSKMFFKADLDALDVLILLEISVLTLVVYLVVCHLHT